jgi:hypothetical protein
MLAVGSGERVSSSTLRWIGRFRQDAALRHYRPHITLGYGKPNEERDLPKTFLATRIGIFQLGNHCTCVRPIAEARLKRPRNDGG